VCFMTRLYILGSDPKLCFIVTGIKHDLFRESHRDFIGHEIS